MLSKTARSDNAGSVALPIGKSVFREPESRKRGGGPKPLSASQRVAHFWSKVKIGNAHECWLWQGGTFRGGYGMYGGGRYTKADGTIACDVRYAHRTAYELTHGPIARGLHMMHACDNPVCCNPAHLSPGTPKDNLYDAVQKGRLVFGRGRRNKSRAA